MATETEQKSGGRAGSALLLRRLAAYAVDLLLAFVFYALLQSWLFPLVAARYEAAFVANGWLLELYILLTISLPIWLTFILAERSRWQATAGKRLLGLRVASPSGARPTTGQIVLRTAGKLLPWELGHLAVNVPTNPWLDAGALFSPWRAALLGFVYLLLLAYLIAAIRQPQRTLYDRLAGTVVIPTAA